MILVKRTSSQSACELDNFALRFRKYTHESNKIYCTKAHSQLISLIRVTGAFVKHVAKAIAFKNLTIILSSNDEENYA